MRTVYACLFDVHPQPPDSSTDTVAKLWAMILSGVETQYRDAWQSECTLAGDEGTWAPLAGHAVGIGRAKTGVCELRVLDWQHPDRADPTLRWHTSMQLARNGPRLEVAASLRVASTQAVIKPLDYSVARPAWLDPVFAGFACFAGKQRLQREPVELVRDNVELFVEDTLCARDRSLPVIIVSPEQGTRDYVIDPVALQAGLVGHAQVICLRDIPAAFRLTDCLQRKELSCYNGAVRLFWPGFARSDNPEQHPLYFADSLRWHAEHGTPLAQHLFRMLIGIAGFRFGQPPIARLVRELLDQEKKERIQRLLARVSDDKETKEILDELERSWDETKHLQQERDQARAEMAELNRHLEMLRAEQAEREGERPGRKARFEHVADAVAQARAQFADTLAFLPSALESAADTPFQRPDEVFALLQALDDLVHVWRQRGSIGKSWYNALKPKGFEYKEHISDTTYHRYGEEYHFVCEGQRIFCGNHVTLGKGGANTCLSVHWARDDAAKRLIIGWIGRHRTNTLS
jgi:hypothetical protein